VAGTDGADELCQRLATIEPLLNEIDKVQSQMELENVEPDVETECVYFENQYYTAIAKSERIIANHRESQTRTYGQRDETTHGGLFYSSHSTQDERPPIYFCCDLLLKKMDHNHIFWSTNTYSKQNI
jgi:hypothetical protein